jgi:hypothetical protein
MLKRLSDIKNRYHHCNNNAKCVLVLPASASMEGPGPSPNLARGSGYHVRTSQHQKDTPFGMTSTSLHAPRSCGRPDVRKRSYIALSENAYAGTSLRPKEPSIHCPPPLLITFSTSGTTFPLVTPNHDNPSTLCDASRLKHPRLQEGDYRTHVHLGYQNQVHPTYGYGRPCRALSKHALSPNTSMISKTQIPPD